MMRYGFIRLKNDDGSLLYMETREYERYEGYEVFKSHAQALVIYDNIYIGCFPLIFKEEEIKEYNPDAKIIDEIPVTDICFRNKKATSIAKILNCDN